MGRPGYPQNHRVIYPKKPPTAPPSNPSWLSPRVIYPKPRPHSLPSLAHKTAHKGQQPSPPDKRIRLIERIEKKATAQPLSASATKMPVVSTLQVISKDRQSFGTLLQIQNQQRGNQDTTKYIKIAPLKKDGVLVRIPAVATTSAASTSATTAATSSTAVSAAQKPSGEAVRVVQLKKLVKVALVRDSQAQAATSNSK